jgi:hypothetical protein
VRNHVARCVRKASVSKRGAAPDPWETQQEHDAQVSAIVEREQAARKQASASSPATQPQKKMLAATAKRKGLTVAEDLRIFCSDTLKRDLVSAKDLTKGEASTVIDALMQLPDKQ